MPDTLTRMIFRRLVVVLALLLSSSLSACSGPGTSKVDKSHHKFLILLCQASDIATLPHDLAYYQKLFLAKTPGLRNVWNYFVDQSYGNSDIEGTVIKDWLKTKRSKSDLEALKPKDQPNHWRTFLASACVEEFGVDPKDFTAGIITIWNLQGADGGATSIKVGGVNYPATNAGAGANFGENSVSFFTHEMLHMLGLSHARGPFPGDSKLLQFKADSTNDHTFGSKGFEEYGDCWTIMGCGRWTLKTSEWGDAGPSLSAANRFRLGWLPGNRVYLWNGATTKITLAPANRPEVAGQLLIRTPVHPAAGGTCCGFYMIEYIEKSGWDANLGMDKAVLIHEIRTDSPNHTYLVSRSIYGAWLPGQVFLDTANRIRISIDSYGDAAVLSLSATGPGDDGLAKCNPPGYRDGAGSKSAPSLKIESPLDGAHAVAGFPVTLRAAAFDPTIPSATPSAEPVPDGRVFWFEGTDPIGTGKSATHTFAAPGTYTVSVVAQDIYCLQSSAQVTVQVDPPKAATVVILEPVNGQEYLVGPPAFAASVQLKASGSSDIKTFDWIDSGPAGYLGSGASTFATIPLTSGSHNCVTEPHVITVRAKTSSGEVVSASVTIVLKTNCIR